MFEDVFVCSACLWAMLFARFVIAMNRVSDLVVSMPLAFEQCGVGTLFVFVSRMDFSVCAKDVLVPLVLSSARRGDFDISHRQFPIVVLGTPR